MLYKESLKDVNHLFVIKAGYNNTVARPGKEKRIILDYKVLYMSIKKIGQALTV
jgi:hypothetical protein